MATGDSERDADPLDAALDACGDPRHAGRGLALALRTLPPWVSIELAANWATSSESAQRRAIIDALAWPFRLVGADVVIDHLSRDPDPEIRIAAARAAWARRDTGGDDGVLDRLADDPAPAVRNVVRLAISR